MRTDHVASPPAMLWPKVGDHYTHVEHLRFVVAERVGTHDCTYDGRFDTARMGGNWLMYSVIYQVVEQPL